MSPLLRPRSLQPVHCHSLDGILAAGLHDQSVFFYYQKVCQTVAPPPTLLITSSLVMWFCHEILKMVLRNRRWKMSNMLVMLAVLNYVSQAYVGHCYDDRRLNLIAVVMALDIHMSHWNFSISNMYVFLHVCAREDVKFSTY